MDPVVVDTIVGALAGGAAAGLGEVAESAVKGTARDAVVLYRGLKSKVVNAVGDNGADAINAVESDTTEETRAQLKQRVLDSAPSLDDEVVELAARLQELLTNLTKGSGLGHIEVQGDQYLTTIDTVHGGLHIGRRGDDANPR